ncbi:MAG: AAA family ATPase, partial [Lachnospiraceae bacterium]|nr:AAA family ATPase [Lachnospiraceae bacterium]
MKILECYIENFGTLHGMKCTLKEGLNTLNADNGWGKSTFAAFIRAMFYGMDAKKRGSRYDQRDYRTNLDPWQGGRYGGYLIFEVNGKRYRATRYFGDMIRDDSFELVDLETGNPSEDYSERLGEELFGIDASGFERTVYIPQNSLQTGKDESINARLIGLLEGDMNLGSYDNAVKILKECRRELKVRGGRGKIDGELDEIASIEHSIRQAQEKVAETNSLKEVLKDAVEDKRIKRNAEEAAQKDLNEFLSQNMGGKKTVGFLVFGLILLLLDAIVIGFDIQTNGPPSINNLSFLMKIGLGVLIVAILLIITGIILKIKGKQVEKQTTEELDRLQDAVKEGRLAYEDATARESELNRQIDTLSAETEDINQLRENLTALKEETEKDRQHLWLLDETIAKLSEAKENLTGNYLDRMRRHFDRYIKELFPEGLEAGIDNDLQISVEGQGAMHPLQTLSMGTQDLINLCARFALADALYEEDKPCIVLDDVMNNLDNKHFNDLMKVVEKLSDSYQIIYLTCNTSRIPVETT